MAQTHLNTVLNDLGFEQADIDNILAVKDDATDFVKDPFIAKVFTGVEEKVKNDPKFWEALDENNVNEGLKKKIEAQQYGRAANIMRSKVLKGLGLKEEDLGELSEDDKKNVEVYVQKAGEKYASSKVSDKQLQADLVETRKKLEKLELEIPEKETTLKTALQTQFDSEKLDFIILAALGQVKDLAAPAEYLLGNLSAKLKSQYGFAVTGWNATPVQKDKPTLKVIEGTKELTLNDLIIKQLTTDKLIKEPVDHKRQQGKTVVIEPDGTGKVAISSHIMKEIEGNKASV